MSGNSSRLWRNTGGCFTISLLDKEWRPDLGVEEAIALADKCIAEARRPVHPPTSQQLTLRRIRTLIARLPLPAFGVAAFTPGLLHNPTLPPRTPPLPLTPFSSPVAASRIHPSPRQIRSRLAIAPPNYVMKIVDRDGARVIAERKSAEVINTS